jgi:hypothetical protein
MSDETAGKESAGTIIPEATKCRSGLTELAHQLQTEIDEIVLAAAKAGRPLSDDDKARREARRADQRKVQAAFKELAFATLERLNNSADVVELKGRLDAINGSIGDDLVRLKKVAKHAKVAAKVADGLAELAAVVVGAVLKK